jgi:hypothetical protein
MTDLGVSAKLCFERELKSYLKSKYEPFIKILKECNAVISGSSVLKCCIDKPFYSNDFDIYVRIEDSVPLLKFIFGSDFKLKKKATFGRYCPTFLNKNGIRTIYHDDYNNCFSNNVDVMTVRNSTTPIDVVKKFDLTFCQVWYDGECIYAVYPEDVNSKCGYLRGDYIEPFLNNNKFLVARYEKYIKRGFTIKMNFPDEHTIEQDLMGINKIRKFKDLSITELNTYYDTDAKKKHFISHLLINLLTNGGDGYDSEEYESLESLNEFGEENVEQKMKEFKDRLFATMTVSNNNKTISNWLSLFESKP